MDFRRQRTLDGIGSQGQQRIESARVLIVGAGGLGSPAARYLAAAGIGHITLVDFDTVDATNLHRQILYAPGDEGQPKAQLAAKRLTTHSSTHVEGRNETFHPDMIAGHDVVLDCTDEAGTRALIHACCVEQGVPLVWAAVEGWTAQWATVLPGGPCLRCLWPDPAEAPSCADVGILGPVVGLAGVWQALAALRIIAGIEVPAALHVVDLRTDETLSIPMQRRAGCSCAAAAK